MAEKNTPILSPEYLDFRNEITSRIRSAQYEALKAVNKEMIAFCLLYTSPSPRDTR